MNYSDKECVVQEAVSDITAERAEAVPVLPFSDLRRKGKGLLQKSHKNRLIIVSRGLLQP
ncbi:TPA: hypothetical protein JLT83_004535 [Escherichia coli]|uniref:hypothetical protein n=1 Tax=Escherichia coli TaxID=562 RepID=UPI00278BAEE5|nr:hypothetical protein [Escherichia coli]HAW3708022.1 hypothetical protein [Escherichia coli]